MLEPIKDQSFKEYVLRFSKLISLDEEFVLIGVSFGGVLAVELNKILNPKAIILISSVITHNQLPTFLVRLGKLGILKIIPFIYFKPPMFLMNYLFGAENKTLLKEIISYTKPTLIQWSLTQMIHWQNKSTPRNLLRIHGTNDRLIPLKGEAFKVNEGGHFMIVDKASEISKIINDWKKLNIQSNQIL